VFQTFEAMKLHFTSPKYNAFKYNFKTRSTVQTFDRRNDKYFFQKVYRNHQTDYRNFILANILHDEFFIGSFTEDAYLNWISVIENLEYRFLVDIDKMKDMMYYDNVTFDEMLTSQGSHPWIFKMVMREEINRETLMIFDMIFRFFKTWDRDIQEDIIWPAFHMKLDKYLPFVVDCFGDGKRWKNLLRKRIQE